MKKVMALVLALVLVFALVPMSVSARNLSDAEKALIAELEEHIKVKDGEFQLPDDVINQAENYLMKLDKELTATEITAIKAEVAKAQAAVKAENTGDAAKWSAKTKDAILEYVDNASKAIGLKAEADATGAIVIKDAAGKEVVKNDKLEKTGFGAESMVIVGLCTVALLSACVFVSKKVDLF
jgi:hypothetical protein